MIRRIPRTGIVLVTCCVGLGSALVIGLRATRFQERSARHGAMATLGVRISNSGQPIALLSRVQIQHHVRMERKYRAAAAHPFRPLAPDPPEP